MGWWTEQRRLALAVAWSLALLRPDDRRAWLDIVLLGVALVPWALAHTGGRAFSALSLGLGVLAFAAARATKRGGRIGA